MMMIPIGLAILGLLLIFLEFFLPGAIMAIGGAALLIASGFFFYMENPNIFSLFAFMAFLATATFVVVRVALWRIAKKGMISDDSQEGYQASLYVRELVGKLGIASTDLKPSGFVMIEEESYEALSKSGYIDKGTPILVMSGQGSHLFVKEVKK